MLETGKSFGIRLGLKVDSPELEKYMAGVKSNRIKYTQLTDTVCDKIRPVLFNESLDESEQVLVETSVAIPDFKRRPKRKTSRSSYVFDYTDADFEALSHHLNLAYKRATTTPKISAATLIYLFKLYSQ